MRDRPRRRNRRHVAETVERRRRRRRRRKSPHMQRRRWRPHSRQAVCRRRRMRPRPHNRPRQVNRRVRGGYSRPPRGPLIRHLVRPRIMVVARGLRRRARTAWRIRARTAGTRRRAGPLLIAESVGRSPGTSGCGWLARQTILQKIRRQIRLNKRQRKYRPTCPKRPNIYI